VYLFSNRRAFLLALAWATSVSEQFRIARAEPASGGADPQDSADDPVYKPGGDVKPPKLIHYVEPEFSPASKEAFVEGTVKISTVITRDGKPSECRVASGLSSEEDRTAMEALKQWTFQPGTKGDKPVRVQITVEIDFHLL